MRVGAYRRTYKRTFREVLWSLPMDSLWAQLKEMEKAEGIEALVPSLFVPEMGHFRRTTEEWD